MKTSSGGFREAKVIDTRRLTRMVFWACVGIELLLLLADYLFNYLDVSGERSIRRIWNIAREESLPTWFSSIQAQLLGLTVMLIGRLEAGGNARWKTTVWMLIGLFFFWVGIDDYAQVHERLGGALERLARNGQRTASAGMLWHNPSFAWHTLIAPFFALCALGTLLFLALPFWRLGLWPYLVLGFGCWAVAQGLDFVEGLKDVGVLYRRVQSVFGVTRYYAVTHGFKVLEESLEMFGTTLLWVGFLKYFSQAANGVRLQLVDGPASGDSRSESSAS